MRRPRTKGGSSPIGFGFLALVIGLTASALGAHAETFRIATYNVYNYLDAPAEKRHPKSEEAKTKVRESILAIKPDVLALEEIGSISALQELRGSLKTAGLDLPYWEHVNASDTNIHIAVLSKFPFTSVRPQTNDDYLLNGKRLFVRRGFAVVDIRVNTNYSFTLIAAHLKSKLPSPLADEVELRSEEANILREKVDAAFAANPNVNLVVLGDLNDYKNSKAIRTILGRGKRGLLDTRPAERNVENLKNPFQIPDGPAVTWTHYYSVEDLYSRLDYILLSPGMAREWVANESYVLAMPDWGKGSDHRPVVVTIEAQDK